MGRVSTLVRRPANLRGLAVVIGLLLVIGNLLHTTAGHAATPILPQGFIDHVALSGLTRPTNVRFSPDGRVFVAEKSGLVKVFQSLNDTTPTVFADLRTEVDDWWDRGLLGLALDPMFPARPYVYLAYTYDHIIGDPAPPPKWNDTCPTPPGPGTDGCVVSNRLSRLTADGDAMVPGSERVLIEGWCQQFQTHSIGDLVFGPDGALYVSGGDGAGPVDYGQLGGTYSGDKANPCGDPPSPAGTALQPPSAQGGALRSQSLRRPSTQPTVLSGAILRVDPDTGDARPDNPLASRTDANAKRIVAYGMRNPFRFTFRPGTSEIWFGDVGANTWEEINRIVAPTAGVTNFGWPCYEGAGRQPSYDALNLTSCESLYSAGGVTGPYFSYNHGGGVVSGDGCPTSGTAATTGLAFYQGGAYPSPKYDGALFFADYARNCIWAMLKGANGLPDPSLREPLVTNASSPVDLEIGPGGDLFYVDLLGGKVHRIVYTSGNQAPNAVATASPTNGQAPLTVDFSAAASTDPDDPVGTLTYAWDFTSDGVVDSTAPQASFTYQSRGQYLATLRVTDPHGASASDAVAITVGNTAPVVTIDKPVSSLTWKVGDTIQFSGHATDNEDGNLPASSLTWSLLLHHCTTLDSCHVHPVQDFTGVSSGSFSAPDHEYPSWLELSLKATDSGGLSDQLSVRLDPKTVNLTFASSPSGLQLAAGAQTHATPFVSRVIVGSANSVTAPSPQTLSGVTYAFIWWSDHGTPSHTVTAPAAPTTYTARYVKYTPAYFNLRNSNNAGPPDARFKYGKVGDIPVAGDWNGDGIVTPGVFRDGYWYLRNSNTAGPYDVVISYGTSADVPVVGDWNGDGVDTIGVFRAGSWNLRNSNTPGLPDIRISYGTTGDVPVVGDWNNDRRDTIGVFRAGSWNLRNSNTPGLPDIRISYGTTGDVPVVGDWNSDGRDTIGVFRAGSWNLRNSNTPGLPNVRISYGTTGDVPVVGDWNNDRRDTIGTFR